MVEEKNLRYLKSHEWASLAGDTVTVGISKHAADEVKDIVFVELPEVGKVTTKEASFGVIESVKAVFDTYAPVDGEVTEINQKVVDNPETVNKDPLGEGWMIKIKLNDKSQFESLMDNETYKKFLENEKSH